MATELSDNTDAGKTHAPDQTKIVDGQPLGSDNPSRGIAALGKHYENDNKREIEGHHSQNGVESDSTKTRFESIHEAIQARADRIRSGFAALLDRSPVGALADEQREITVINLELDTLTGDTATAIGHDVATDLRTLGEDYFVSQDVVGKALDNLTTEGEAGAEQAVVEIVQAIKHVSALDKPLPYGLTVAIATRPELMQQMVDASQQEDVSSWDRLAIKAGLDDAAKSIAIKSTGVESGTGNPFDPVSIEVSADKQLLIDADEKEAQKIAALVKNVPVASSRPAILLREYGKFEDQGVSADDVATYARYKDRYSTPTAEDITFVGEQYKTASDATKILLDQGKYDPSAVLRVDKYLGSLELDPEQSVDNHLVQITHLARMLGCDNNSAEAAKEAQETFDDLIQRGANVEGLMKLFPHPQHYEKFLTTEHGEQFDESKDLLATLAGLKDFSYGEVRPESVVKDMLNYPETYKQSLVVVKERWQKVMENGYPPNLASKPVEFILSDYAINLGASYSEGAYNDSRANYIDTHLQAMQLLGDSSVSLLRLTTGSEPKNDYFAGNLARELHEGKTIDAVDIHAQIKQAADGLKEVATKTPDIYAALLLRTDIGTAGDLRDISAYTKMAGELAKRRELLDLLPRDVGSTATEGLVARIAQKMDHSTHTFPQEIFDSLDGLESVILSNENFDKQQLVETFVGMGDDSKEFSQFLLSEEVQNSMNNEQLAAEVNSALFTLRYEIGRYDFVRALQAYSAIDPPMKGYLQKLISSEAKLGGAATSAAAQKYYEHAPTILSRRDKDGNPFDSPEMLYLALEPLSRYARNEQYEAELDWFLNDQLPVAAAESVIHFREEAIVAGIEDTPSAVYEWIHKDSEKVTELSHRYLREYVNGGLAMASSTRMIEDPETTERLIKAMGNHVDRMSDNFRIFVNISPQVLQKVVDGGGTIKSIQDDGIVVADRHEDYMSKRSGIEIAMGIRSLKDTEDHPVYGTSGFIGDGVPSGAYGYGEVMLSYKLTPELADRTSYSPEDSFHGPYRLTSRDAQILRMIKNGQGIGHARTSEYTETQIKDGLAVYAADQIYVPNEEMVVQVQAALPPEFHDKIVVRPREGTYEASFERSIYNSIVLPQQNEQDS